MPLGVPELAKQLSEADWAKQHAVLLNIQNGMGVMQKVIAEKLGMRQPTLSLRLLHPPKKLEAPIAAERWKELLLILREEQRASLLSVIPTNIYAPGQSKLRKKLEKSEPILMDDEQMNAFEAHQLQKMGPANVCMVISSHMSSHESKDLEDRISANLDNGCDYRFLLEANAKAVFSFRYFIGAINARRKNPEKGGSVSVKILYPQKEKPEYVDHEEDLAWDEFTEELNGDQRFPVTVLSERAVGEVAILFAKNGAAPALFSPKNNRVFGEDTKDWGYFDVTSMATSHTERPRNRTYLGPIHGLNKTMMLLSMHSS